MAPPRWLLSVTLLALCWGPSMAGSQDRGGERCDPLLASPGPGTFPLQTLRCHNDYTSRIVCRWADTQDAQRVVNVTLYRRLNDNPLQPVSCELSDNMLWADCPSPPCVPRRCVIPYTLFVNSDKDNFSFQPDRPLGTQLTVTLTQHVQPPAPMDLRITAAMDHFQLTWSVALRGSQGQWLSDLEFEVVYRQFQDSWEDASTLYTTSPQADLGPEHLLPSSTYVARVRTRLGQGSGLSGRPSPWSPEVRWESQPGDKGQPQNLQCFFDGGTVLSCSWEVRSEVTSSVSFTLFYKSSPKAEEKECSSVLKEEVHGHYIRHRCQVPVADPRNHSKYFISVRPKVEEKCIKSSENIQMAPPMLNVTKSRDNYILRWEVEKMSFSHIEHTFQVQYKKAAVSWQESKSETLPRTHVMSLPPLEPSTRYQARVRVKPDSGYDGIWSEWSEVCSWDTDWVLPMWGLAFILVFTTLTLLLALRFCGLYGYRLNRKWEEKIPNPSKSHLFQNGSAGLRLPGSMCILAGMSPSHKGLWDSPFPGLEGLSPVDCTHSEVSHLTIEDPNHARDSPSEPAMTQATSDLPTEPPLSPPSCLPATSSRLERKVSGFDFDGPYLGLPHSPSLPELMGPEVLPKTGVGHRPPSSGSLEYMCLPEGEQVQLVPLAQVLGQGQAGGGGRRPCPGAEAGSPSLEARTDPAHSAPALTMQGQGMKGSPTALSSGAGGPEGSTVVSDYVSTSDLALAPPTGAPTARWVPPLGLPSDQNNGLPLRLAVQQPEAPAPMMSVFDSYVELPSAMGQPPEPPLGTPAPLVANSPILSPKEPRVDVTPVSPHPEGLLVLQQVGDYCFLPGVGSGAPSPQSKSPSPGPCPEIRDLDPVLQAKKPPCQAIPQVPAIQLFKALKQQDYLSLPPWDVSRPGEVC